MCLVRNPSKTGFLAMRPIMIYHEATTGIPKPDSEIFLSSQFIGLDKQIF